MALRWPIRGNASQGTGKSAKRCQIAPVGLARKNARLIQCNMRCVIQYRYQRCGAMHFSTLAGPQVPGS
jgi:hypothetical protein